jgi:Fur family zinc uptake transcriptional regulator
VIKVLRALPGTASAYDVIEALPNSLHARPPAVYRSLERLIAAGLVHRVESRKAYVACSNPGHEHEVVLAICDDCGRVVEIEDHALCRLVLAWRKQTGFTPRTSAFEISGRCADCVARLRGPPTS